MFESNRHHFFGTVNMLIGDNLATHAIGGYFCNFSTVHQFCRFCNCKNQLEQCLPIKTFSLRTKTGYENNIAALGTNPTYSSLYGLKENSCLNEFSYLSCYIWLTTRSCSWPLWRFCRWHSIKCSNTLYQIRVFIFDLRKF